MSAVKFKSKRKIPRGNRTLLTVAGIRQLESELQADIRSRAELDERIAEKKKKLDAALLFLPEPELPEKPKFVLQKEKARPAKSAPRINGRLTWTSGVMMVLNEKKSGMSHQDILAELRKTELGENVSEGAKGFYNAVKRLTDSEKVVKSGGLIYSAKIAREIRDRGEQLPARVVGRGGSNSIVLAILNDNPQGLSGPELTEKAAKHPDAPPSLRVHRHYIYNVLKTLRKDGLVAKEADVYRLVKPQAMQKSHGVH